MEQNVNSIWQECLVHLSSHIPSKQFNIWFHPIEPVRLEGNNTIVVKVPSAFFCEYIEQNFELQMQQALRSVLGEHARLRYLAMVDSTSNNTTEGCLLTSMSEASLSTSPASIPQGISVPHNDVGATNPTQWDTKLLPPFTFDSFIRGESNDVALSLARRICVEPGDAMMNPFFIYGPPGVGKTHMMNAMGWEILRQHSDLRVLYVTTLQFVQQFTAASKNKKVPDFIKYYQQIDVLLLDDIQELEGKERSQQAFFEIFNHLYSLGKQIVLTSDRSVSDFNALSERIVSRMAGSLTAQIKRPDLCLRREILNKLASQGGVVLTEEVSDFIVKNASHSVREIDGVLSSIFLSASVTGSPIDLSFSREILSRTIRLEEREVTLENIQRLVCENFHIPAHQVKGKSRRQDIVMARHVIMFLANKHTKESLSSIGHYLGGRSHATVIHGCNSTRDAISIDHEFATTISKLEQQLQC